MFRRKEIELEGALKGAPRAEAANKISTLTKCMAREYFNAEKRDERAMVISMCLGEYIHAIHKYPRKTSKKLAAVFFLGRGLEDAMDRLEREGNLDDDKKRIAMHMLLETFDDVADDSPEEIEKMLKEVMYTDEIVEKVMKEQDNE